MFIKFICDQETVAWSTEFLWSPKLLFLEGNWRGLSGMLVIQLLWSCSGSQKQKTQRLHHWKFYHQLNWRLNTCKKLARKSAHLPVRKEASNSFRRFWLRRRATCKKRRFESVGKHCQLQLVFTLNLSVRTCGAKDKRQMLLVIASPKDYEIYQIGVDSYANMLLL